MVRRRFTCGSLKVRLALVWSALIALAGCSTAPIHDDAGQINEQLLQILAAGGRPLCVDNIARGEPLAIYRTMQSAPDPIRRELGWHIPRPLNNGQSLDGRQLVDQELWKEQSMLRETPQDKDRLALPDQLQLNALASEGSLMLPEQGIMLAQTTAAPRAQVRWWLRNRFDAACGPAYTLSAPVIFRDVAFVSVTAGHHGSTYAFRKTKNVWGPVAMWSSWLY